LEKCCLTITRLFLCDHEILRQIVLIVNKLLITFSENGLPFVRIFAKKLQIKTREVVSSSKRVCCTGLILRKIMSIRSLVIFIGVVCLTTLFIVSAKAQFTLTGTNYTQNFNTISNGLPSGWSVRTNATATGLGITTTFNNDPVSWATQTGQFGNAAGTTNNLVAAASGAETSTQQGSFTNRCPSIRQTAAFGDPGAAFVFQIANTAGFSNLAFSVDLNMLSVQNHSTTWTVDYAVGDSPSSFTLLGINIDPGVFGTTTQTYSLGADANNQSQNVWIRIVALSASAGTSGSRDTFGIDNFSLSWTAVSPAVVTPIIIVAIVNSGGNVQIDFNGQTSDDPSSFLLLGSPQVAGTYVDTGATITSPSPGMFRATCAASGPQQFYRIERN
jgi:hypothetical protein